MKLTELSDSEILLKLEELSQSRNVKLAFAHKMFYVSLLHLCEAIGELDAVSKQYYVELSVNAFVLEFKVSRTTVVQSLGLLSSCGAIRREKQKRGFRKLSKDEYVKNDAFRTFVNVTYLQVF